ncbi:MAG: exodeoxyribonuclease VII small subunit [Oscillospiraceae bacterium]|nr:exodeoxyribonuclease VII small subunit [Oscillospiraceae bacterium]
MKKYTYEQAMDRLSAITEALENGSLPLDDSLKLYTEASELIRFCSNCLDNAEQKITELSEKGEAEDET